MKYRSMALAIAVAAAGLAGGQAFAQDRDVTVSHVRDDGAVVTRHIERSEGVDGPVVHRVTRIERPDGTTVIRRTTRRWSEPQVVRMRRTVVIHHRYVPMNHVVVREVREHRPAYVVNRHVTVIRDEG